MDHGKGAGRKPGPENKKTEGRVKRMIKANPNVSSRDLAKKIGMSQSYVQNAQRRELDYIHTGYRTSQTAMSGKNLQHFGMIECLGQHTQEPFRELLGS